MRYNVEHLLMQIRYMSLRDSTSSGHGLTLWSGGCSFCLVDNYSSFGDVISHETNLLTYRPDYPVTGGEHPDED